MRRIMDKVCRREYATCWTLVPVRRFLVVLSSRQNGRNQNSSSKVSLRFLQRLFERKSRSNGLINERTQGNPRGETLVNMTRIHCNNTGSLSQMNFEVMLSSRYDGHAGL